MKQIYSANTQVTSNLLQDLYYNTLVGTSILAWLLLATGYRFSLDVDFHHITSIFRLPFEL